MSRATPVAISMAAQKSTILKSRRAFSGSD